MSFVSLQIEILDVEVVCNCTRIEYLIKCSGSFLLQFLDIFLFNSWNRMTPRLVSHSSVEKETNWFQTPKEEVKTKKMAEIRQFACCMDNLRAAKIFNIANIVLESLLLITTLVFLGILLDDQDHKVCNYYVKYHSNISLYLKELLTFSLAMTLGQFSVHFSSLPQSSWPYSWSLTRCSSLVPSNVTKLLWLLA